MKKKKIYWIVGILAALLLVAGGAYLYTKEKDKVAGTKTETTSNNSAKATDKGADAPEDTTPVQTKPSTTITEAPSTLGTLTDVSLKANLYSQASVASDGSTTMPAGSIAPYFYLNSGTYTVQKMTSGAWEDVITAQSYPGFGGLAAWFMGPNEDNVNYRVLKIEGGKPTAASKTFVIKRSDIKNGTVNYE